MNSLYTESIATYQERENERVLANVLAATMIGLYLTNVVSGLGRYWGVSTSTISLASKLLILVALLRCFFIYFARINWIIFTSTFLFALVTVVQQLFFPENRQYLFGIWGEFTDSTFFVFLVAVLPVIYTISVINDFDILLKRMQSAALVLSIVTAIILAVYGGDAFEQYSMGFGNAMILPTVLMIRRTADHQEKGWRMWALLAFSMANVFSVAMYGSRGAFVAVIGYAVYTFLWNQILQKRLSAIISAGVILVVSMSYKEILKIINRWAQNLGFYSRTLMSFSSENISDSGRSKIFDTVMAELQRHPFRIRGINYDYNIFGAYCHNWFLELLYAFGILFGGIACAAIINMIIRTLLKGGRDSQSRFLVCLTFAFFPVCLVSGSIWQSTWFWTWVVLYTRSVQTKP